MRAYPEAEPTHQPENLLPGNGLPPADPADWERFKRELDEAVPAGDGEEVSAINNIVTQLMQAGVNADKVFEQVVTSVARKVVLARSREPARLLRMYRAGNGSDQAMPAAAVKRRPSRSIARGPSTRPMTRP